MLIALLMVPAAFGGTRVATTCSYSDVSAAYNAASAGDIINIPAGDCTWSNSLTVSKRDLVFAGAGASSTTIRRNGRTFDFSGTSGNGTRITGIYFDRGGIFFDGTNAAKDWRIDNNYFNNVNHAIKTDGDARGLIDHNTFFNSYAIYMFFNGRSSQTYPLDVGDKVSSSTNILFIEDNLFKRMTSSNCRPHTLVGNLAARAVIRYNTFDYTPSTCWDALDAHDSNENYPNRGTLGYEIYNNNFLFASGAARTIHLRGGQHLVYNNHFNASMNNPIRITSYTNNSRPERCTGNIYDLDDSDPNSCPDQINHSYFWDNKENCGTADINLCGSGREEPVVNVAPEVNIEGTHFYKFKMPGYTPYIYPHPLQSGEIGDTIPPAPPTDLTPGAEIN